MFSDSILKQTELSPSLWESPLWGHEPGSRKPLPIGGSWYDHTPSERQRNWLSRQILLRVMHLRSTCTVSHLGSVGCLSQNKLSSSIWLLPTFLQLQTHRDHTIQQSKSNTDWAIQKDRTYKHLCITHITAAKTRHQPEARVQKFKIAQWQRWKVRGDSQAVSGLCPCRRRAEQQREQPCSGRTG